MELSNSISPSPSSSSSSSSSFSIQLETTIGNIGPFTGLVICVTGLSKEARKQVRDATERLGGRYSPDLHSQCTHLLVQSLFGCKFEHALKHGLRNGLFVVTLGWFVDSVRKNVRLGESLYSVRSAGEGGLQMGLNHPIRVRNTENYCVPVGFFEDTSKSNITPQKHLQFSGKESGTSRDLVLSGHSIYVDSEISNDVRIKVIDAATEGDVAIVNPWFIGCGATHVVSEGLSIWRFLGQTDNIVTPQWILKTIEENHVQRLVHLSADLARQVSGIIENYQDGNAGQCSMEQPTSRKSGATLEERRHIADNAKTGVRNRRRHHMELQARHTQIRPITPSTLMDSVCWSISDPTSAACVYTDVSVFNDHCETTSVFHDTRGNGRGPEASFENLCRPLTECEKSEKIFKSPFLAILFPIDRFGEMGPSSRSFFSDNGFTCLQLLDYIYKFYQENMSVDEVTIAIHTDSKLADRLRSVYVTTESLESGSVQFKRIDFLGTRRSFEMLKRVNGDNSSHVYELLIRA